MRGHKIWHEILLKSVFLGELEIFLAEAVIDLDIRLSHILKNAT